MTEIYPTAIRAGCKYKGRGVNAWLPVVCCPASYCKNATTALQMLCMVRAWCAPACLIRAIIGAWAAPATPWHNGWLAIGRQAVGQYEGAGANNYANNSKRRRNVLECLLATARLANNHRHIHHVWTCPLRFGCQLQTARTLKH